VASIRFDGHDRNARDVAQMPADQSGIVGVGVDAGADRGRAHVDFANQKHRFLQALLVFSQHHRIGRKLLAQRHRNRVLQLRAAHLDDVPELIGLVFECLTQHRHGFDQLHNAGISRELERRRVDVVGALAHVDVLVGMQEFIIALGPAEQLQCAVRNHLVGIHIGRGAGAALNHVDHEFIVQPAGPHFLRGGDDGVGKRLIKQPQLAVALRRGQLDRGQRRDQIRIDRDRGAANRKILHRTQGVDAIIGIRRNIPVAQQIVFASRAHRRPFRRGAGGTSMKSATSGFSKSRCGRWRRYSATAGRTRRRAAMPNRCARATSASRPRCRHVCATTKVELSVPCRKIVEAHGR
jgi:hypothetical protein